MDENRLPELPQESFRPMIVQSVQLEQFLGEELIFCFRDLDGVHTFTTCYGDIYKTVNALRDYVRLLESVCDQWELTGFHRATYEYHAEKLRKETSQKVPQQRCRGRCPSADSTGCQQVR